MKSFGLSIVLAVVVIIAVIFNACYADRVYAEILCLLDDFPETAEENGQITSEMTRAKESFEKHTGYFYYVLSKSDIKELICDFYDVFSYYRAGDTASYAASLEKTKIRLTLIANSEKLSFREIFGS